MPVRRQMGAIRALLVGVVLVTMIGCSDSSDSSVDTDMTGSSPSSNSNSVPATSAAPGTTRAPTTTSGTIEAPTIAPYTSATYVDAAHWICRADLEDVCDADTSITDVSTDGTFIVRPSAPASEPGVDCFYVYPTSSEDSTLNSDFAPGAEVSVAGGQAAPFSDVCRVYAPLYRSVTLTALLSSSPDVIGDGYDVAYRDVVDAWRHYLSNDNAGRGVILVGHSQGSAILARLLREEIDPAETQRGLIVSALLTGPPDLVPDRYVLLDDLAHLPPCRALDQTGCVVSFSTFRSASPPPDNSRFAKNRGADGRSGCVNPASPAGGPGVLSSAFTSGTWALTDGSAAPSTPYMDLPGLVTSECVQQANHTYLAITVNADLADPRADNIPGDLSPEWGLHLVDMPLTAGSLLAMTRAQIAAYDAAPG
jgi:pimeloyl-ACP methyl ester carboxylesterase